MAPHSCSCVLSHFKIRRYSSSGVKFCGIIMPASLVFKDQAFLMTFVATSPFPDRSMSLQKGETPRKSFHKRRKRFYWEYMISVCISDVLSRATQVTYSESAKSCSLMTFAQIRSVDSAYGLQFKKIAPGQHCDIYICLVILLKSHHIAFVYLVLNRISQNCTFKQTFSFLGVFDVRVNQLFNKPKVKNQFRQLRID